MAAVTTTEATEARVPVRPAQIALYRRQAFWEGAKSTAMILIAAADRRRTRHNRT
jgi:hypothetical protein